MTLLEVMIAVIILGFGLLGLGVLQAKSIAMGQSSYFRSIAADMGNDLADRIRAQRTPFMVSTDATVTPKKPPDFAKCTQSTATVTCVTQGLDRTTDETFLTSEMQTWLDTLRAQLPNGTYTLAQASSASTDYLRYTLTITWLDNRRDASTTSYSVVIE
jgi:type IV pilus assembly protein PilV